MKRIKINRSTKQYIIVSAILFVVLGGSFLVAFFLSTGSMKETYEARITAATRTIDENSRMVYVAKEEILSGEILTDENTEYKSVLSSQPADSFIDESDLGKKVLITLQPDTQITKACVTDADITSDLRETNFTVISNSANIVNNDTVDVRLLYPNGENVVVLPKKVIKDMVEGSPDCFFWLSEEEILRMSSAIVDAYQYEGAVLYTTEYIEPSIQEASIANYTPSQQTINLIANDPNIVEIASQYLSSRVRSQLEKRLADKVKDNTGSITTESDTTTDASTYIEENTDTIVGPSYDASETISGATESGSGLYDPTYDSDSSIEGVDENYFEIGEGGQDLG